MDSQKQVEELRSKLAAMPLSEVQALCDKAGVKPSTVRKFRSRHIKEIGGFKLAALLQAVAATEKAGA